jgi:hypothetical protein
MFEDQHKKDKRQALAESDQFTDYLLGKKKLFGDEMGQYAPLKFINLTTEEKWLQNRAPLSMEQKENLNKAKADLRIGVASEEDMKNMIN